MLNRPWYGIAVAVALFALTALLNASGLYGVSVSVACIADFVWTVSILWLTADEVRKRWSLRGERR